jgi:hypothetical protein
LGFGPFGLIEELSWQRIHREDLSEEQALEEIVHKQPWRPEKGRDEKRKPILMARANLDISTGWKGAAKLDLKENHGDERVTE